MNEKREIPMSKKLDRKCRKETVGHAKYLEVVARQSQRDMTR